MSRRHIKIVIYFSDGEREQQQQQRRCNLIKFFSPLLTSNSCNLNSLWFWCLEALAAFRSYQLIADPQKRMIYGHVAGWSFSSLNAFGLCLTSTRSMMCFEQSHYLVESHINRRSMEGKNVNSLRLRDANRLIHVSFSLFTERSWL